MTENLHDQPQLTPSAGHVVQLTELAEARLHALVANREGAVRALAVEIAEASGLDDASSKHVTAAWTFLSPSKDSEWLKWVGFFIAAFVFTQIHTVFTQKAVNKASVVWLLIDLAISLSCLVASFTLDFLPITGRRVPRGKRS